jgi:hypothetical protein
MAISETVEKRKLVVTLGEFEAPASWQWEAVRFLRNDDGTDAAPPQNVVVPCTPEEAAAHIGQAAIDMNATMAAKDALIAALREQLATEVAALTEDRDTKVAALTAQRDAAVAAATKVAEADAAWEISVRPLVEAALA